MPIESTGRLSAERSTTSNDPLKLRVRWLAFAAFFVATTWCIPTAPTEAQIFEFGKEAPSQPIPTVSIEAHKRLLRARLTELKGSLKDAKGDAALELAIQAAIRVRELAMQLLDFVDDKPGTSLAAVHGMAITRGGDAFDELFKNLPRLDRELKGEKTPSETKLRQFDRLRDAMQRFVAPGVPKGLDAKVMQRSDASAFVYRYFSPLLRAVEALGMEAPPSPWLTPDGKPSVSLPAADAFDKLAARLAALRDSQPAAAEAATVLAVLRTASAHSDFKPRVSDYFQLITRLTTHMEIVNRASWLNSATRTLLNNALARDMAAFKNPGSRGDAIGKLEAHLRRSRVLDALSTLAAAGLDTKVLRDVLTTALNRVVNGTDVNTGEAILALLDRAFTVMVARRDAKGEAAPEGQQSVLDALKQRFKSAEDNLLRRAERLVTKPDAVNDATVIDAVDQLEIADTDIRLIASFADDMDKSRQFNPIPPSGIRDRLSKQLRYLTIEARRKDARKDLVAFRSQLQRMLAIPSYKALVDIAERNEGGDVLGVTAQQLVKAINRQRSQWGMRWAQGMPIEQTQSIVEALEAITPAAVSVIQLNDQEAGKVLSRWPGWHLDDAGTKETLEALTRRVETASVLAVSGRMKELVTEVQAIEQLAPAWRVAAAMSPQVAGPLQAMPGDARAVLARLVYLPNPEARFGAVHEELALLGRCAQELSLTSVQQNDKQRAAALAHALWALERINRSSR